MPRVHVVKKARKADERFGIQPGDQYYWWEFRNGGVVKSKTYPRRSQLTQSGFLSQIYDLEDGLDWQAHAPEDLASERDNVVSQLEGLRDECEASLENMPEALQESSMSGQLLTERIDALNTLIDELEQVDLEPEEFESDEDREDWLSERADDLEACPWDF